jgi:hypothetical protein
VELRTAVTLTAPWICVLAIDSKPLLRNGVVSEHDGAEIVTVTATVLGVQEQDPVTKTVAIVVCVPVVREV